jgi:hypothetical protein
MPWREPSPIDQQTQFIADSLRETLSVCELGDLYGICRKTAYKWSDRYLKPSPAGLHARSTLPPLPTATASPPAGPRVPRSLRGAQCERQRRASMASRVGPRKYRVCWRVRGLRGD